MKWWMGWIGLAACGAEATSDPGPTPIERARADLPSASVLHNTVIRRSCSPSRGVCHNSSSYPELATPGSLLWTLGAPCNVEIPEPSLGWDSCELTADRLVVGDLTSELAFGERIEPGVWRFGLRVPATITATMAAHFVHADGAIALDLGLVRDRGSVWLRADTIAGDAITTVRIEALSFVEETRVELDWLLAALVVGDPNRNGIWGAQSSAKGALVVPGDPEASYLWRRITGTAPGTRMPLANQALSEPEYVAITCWIQGLGRDTEVIDYSACTPGRPEPQ